MPIYNGLMRGGPNGPAVMSSPGYCLQRDMRVPYSLATPGTYPGSTAYPGSDTMYALTFSMWGEPALCRLVFIAPEALPEWIRDGMAVMDTAGVGHSVEGVGMRTSTRYWFMPPGTLPENIPLNEKLGVLNKML